MLLEQLWAQSALQELHSFTLLITQEDGRSAFVTGSGSRNYATRKLELDAYAVFSDRINAQAPPIPNPINGFQPQIMSNRDVDKMIITMPEKAAKKIYPTQVQLLRWGASFTLNFKLSLASRTYQADGPAIGNAPGLAHYVISFQV